ncbi:MAG: galactose mutarotase [Oscillospiraceae bacterium]|nr:galactose mutarotase [Oscillospiraceae bacterium]
MITSTIFGKTTDGTNIQLYTLTAGQYMAKITNFGATITELHCPDINGNDTDIVLGFDNLDSYLQPCDYFGATIGRFGNRIANGEFKLNGKEYKLVKNNFPNHLHGGKIGFDKKVFDSVIDGESLVCTYLSEDGEEGYPGNLKLTVSFTLSDDGNFNIEYNAVCDEDTVANFTNHSYFNLNGEKSGMSIENHILQINADYFCEADKNVLANGNLIAVKDTDMDFTKPAELRNRLSSDYYAIKACNGFDHNFALNSKGLAATVFSPTTGILVECSTDRPGVQIYTGNMIKAKSKGKCGELYGTHGAICLETQGFPNSTSFKHFPSPVLKKDEIWSSKTTYNLGLK